MIPQLTALDLAARIKLSNPPQLLDVRQPEEHAFVSLPGARLIPLNELPRRWSELEAWKDEEVVVYCHHGMRSLQAAEFLRQQGFGQVSNLAGGIEAWAVAVDPGLPRY
ncbi:MAG: rhodanese-like domain-containing protein [Limisphaerales bacterium]